MTISALRSDMLCALSVGDVATAEKCLKAIRALRRTLDVAKVAAFSAAQN